MLKKISVSLLAAMMLSSVALAFDTCPVSDWENKQENKQEERKVLTFNKEVVKKIMIEENGYHEGSIFNKIDYDKIQLNEFGRKLVVIHKVYEYVDEPLDRLKLYDVRLQPILDAYICDRTINNDFNVEGLTMQIIMENTSGNDFWKALGNMNRAIYDHEYAKQVINGENLRL